MNSRLPYLIALFAAVALIAVGCGGDDDDGGDSDATTTEKTTAQSGGGSSGGGDSEEAAAKKLCDALKDQPKVDTTPAGDPQAAVDAAKKNVAYQEGIVEAINDIPEPDDAAKADALKKYKAANQKALEASKEGLELAQQAIDDPQAAAQNTSKVTEAAQAATEAASEAAEAGADLDLNLENCSPASAG